MQLATATPLVRSSGVIERAQSRVNMNATAFKILSSSLYSDKIGAVLREIGCNAADAHIMAGKPDLPFEVRLPTALNPEFAIKDWGPGLSHEEVMQNYQTYFFSTKTQSNDVTGCFGLGSKSPYAYTDQFTVRAVQDGKMRTYFCAFDETGVPTTSLVSESEAPDDWHSGLEVSMPVARQDQEEFHSKARQIYQWFRVPPRIVGGEQVEPPKLVFQNGRFRKYDASWMHQGYVVMGNVMYPLNHHALSTGLGYEGDDEALRSVITGLYYQNLVIEVPIGTVDITASREAIEYTPRTIENMRAWVRAAIKELAEDLAERLRAIGPLSLDNIRDVQERFVHKDIESYFAGEIRRSLPPDLHDLYNQVNASSVEIDTWGDLVEAKDEPTLRASIWEYDPQNKRKTTRSFYGSIPLRNKVKVIVNDFPKRAFDRVRQLLIDDHDLTLIVISSPDPAERNEVIAALTENPVTVSYTLASALPKPPPKVKGVGNAPKKGDNREVTVFEIGDNPDRVPQHGYAPNKLVAIKDIAPEDRVYMFRYSGGWGARYIGFNGSSQNRRWPGEVYKALNELKTHGLPHPKYLVVNTESYAKSRKLVEDHGFISIDEWIETVLVNDQRVVDYAAGYSIRHINLNSWVHGSMPHARLLFGAALSKGARWDRAKAALEGTAYLASLEALLEEYRQAVEDKKRDDLTRTNKKVPYEGALEQLGVRSHITVERLDFERRCSELDEAYPKLAVVAKDWLLHDHVTDMFDIALEAVAWAVAPPETITPAAQEN